MAFQRFKEYLNDKGDLQKKPIIDPDADTGPSGKKTTKPPKNVTKGKNWKNFEAAQVNDGGDGRQAVPYSAPGTDPGLENADGKDGRANPLGDKGEKNLIYKPKTDDHTLKTSLNKTKTEQFLDTTRGLSTNQYAEYILKQNDAKAVKQIIETVDVIKECKLIEVLVREIKRKGGLNSLVESVLNQPETFSEIAVKLANESHGKNIARQLAKAINEITAEPADEDIPEKKASKSMPPNDDSINSRGKPVVPAKTVKDLPTETDNILMSKGKKLRPEHNLIEALANYKSIRTVMKKLVD